MNQRAVWTCLRAISRSFCVGTSQWMKHGSTISLQSQIGSLLSGMQPKATKDAAVGWQGYGVCILGCAWNNIHRLSPEGADHQQRLLYSVIGAFERRNRKETASYEEEKSVVPPRQCTVSQINENDGKI